MFITLLVVNFIVAFVVCMIIATIFKKPVTNIMQRLVAEDAPYIPIWNKTNVLIAQPSLTGLRLGPTGDYLSLRDVRRVTSR